MSTQRAGESTGEIKIIPTCCSEDCGGRCILKAHVKDGVILRFETDDDETEPQLRACVRGRAYRERVYSAERLRYPLKRVGARGEGRFERTSWDEALDTIAGEMKRIKQTYGPAAFFVNGGMGIMGEIYSLGTIIRLFFKFGGCTLRWGTISGHASRIASEATLGTVSTGNTRDDLINSRLIIMWGWNPVETVWSTGTPFSLIKAKEAGIKFVCVDPRFTDTAATFASQWIPIKPGTDAAMMMAMAYVIIKENLHHQRFLDTYTIGFDKFKEYVLGIVDGIPKTPSWAEAITGVPAATIEGLAREYATSKPAALMPSFAPGRSAYGEQYHRAAITLAAMTGNIGVNGGYSAGEQIEDVGFPWAPMGTIGAPGLPMGENPVEHGVTPPGLANGFKETYRVHSTKVYDAILKGKAGGYPSDIKMAYLAFGNNVNQLLNTNKTIEALKKLEFVVVHELFMTPTAKFADILLPVAMSLERNDIIRPWHHGAYAVFTNKAVEPPVECKTDLEICCELAPRLGISDFSDKAEDEWLREKMKAIYAGEITDYEEFKKKGFHKIRTPEPVVAFKEQIEDPENNPFPTPSGKIEIYCQRIADMNNPQFPPIPEYIEPWEGPDDPLAARYPLQLVTSHSKRRAHSTFDNNLWLREIEPQVVWLSSMDAAARGISNGDEVRVFNDRGQMIIPAKVTERIMPGVVNIGEGAWYAPDENGVDRGGCVNVLTRDERSPAGAFCGSTSLVQVEKV